MVACDTKNRNPKDTCGEEIAYVSKTCLLFKTQQSTYIGCVWGGGPIWSFSILENPRFHNEHDVHTNFKIHDENGYMHDINLLVILH